MMVINDDNEDDDDGGENKLPLVSRMKVFIHYLSMKNSKRRQRKTRQNLY